MPASKAQQKAVSKYMKENYDEIKVRVEKGRRNAIKAQAEAQGQSVNGYINAAIDARMAQEASDSAGIFLPPDALQIAQEAATAAGEAVPAFVSRAVETQAERDRLARKMGG